MIGMWYWKIPKVKVKSPLTPFPFYAAFAEHWNSGLKGLKCQTRKRGRTLACIEITCSVKGYQECNFTVDVGEEFFIFKKIGSKGRAFKGTNTKGQLGHLERTLVVTLWPFKGGMKWWVMIPLTGTYAKWILFSPGFKEKMAVFSWAIFQVA